jgi:hypothetical protein
MKAYKLYTVIACLGVLTGCAGNPERMLQRGYEGVSVVARGAKTGLERGHITKEDAQNVHDLGTSAKSTLDSGKERLQACRAKEAAGEKVDCKKAVNNISLGSGIFQQLEKYLEANQ